jgi:D-arginine dehydrogenase
MTNDARLVLDTLRSAAASGATLINYASLKSAKRDGAQWICRIADEMSGDEIEIRARCIVNAAGAWCDEIAALAGVTPIGLQPMRRTAFTCSAPDGVDVRSWPLVADVDNAYYFKPEGPQLLCSLADETLSPPCDARPEELDVALAIERINDATTLGLRHVRRAWAGLRTFAPDRSLVIGLDPDAPGFCWLAGQGGYGIQTAPAAAHAAAGLVTEGRLPADLLALGVTADQLSPSRLR